MTPQSQSSSVRGGGLCVCVCGVRYVGGGGFCGVVTKETIDERSECLHVFVCTLLVCIW